uniref:Plastid lipid-associated protein/fibrillin conserved domain-containing protein n=1 Tax=Chromera velia CCMP2878 TaxID=1169474 RepID=A0A0G4H2E8_9ALVE|mmetsp:Transcript_34923/g.68940  ORF Transcript_34923/g.68940 Transcript_34923/m.68940 type:complete len:317 (-) Transcript_34923:119-1069(-)|eukprot:Cvel_24420.t1-p1 / transcript=Cvel_24420.t1 / gene=Cvel_24420 / organism=Chromera_velia_CCMP2878 / gene_product=hypothetical protein / transcript_product=hypothetical protein / location=Cvel_scaffold2636:16703-18824(-) / protein_length=316 / sequence_SO=supercontig / SO=protein_coding / is_pseudo=false
MDFLLLFLLSGLVAQSDGFLLFRQNIPKKRAGTSLKMQWGAGTATNKARGQETAIQTLKNEILQLGAALDRGQAYNPTSGQYYKERMDIAREKVAGLVALSKDLPTDLGDERLAGEWELVWTSVPHGIFRSSPFFLAIQDAYERVGAADKAELFFKLHELQTCSWGVSKVGRVAQYIDSANRLLYSEFDTSLFSLTVIPILGWFKLLPTFGGCVVTVSKVELNGNSLDLEVDYTTFREVEGLPGLGRWVWDRKIPVKEVWKRLPWNKGTIPKASVKLLFCDESFRVVEDSGGEVFVYTRPVAPRPPPGVGTAGQAS